MNSGIFFFFKKEKAAKNLSFKEGENDGGRRLSINEGDIVFGRLPKKEKTGIFHACALHAEKCLFWRCDSGERVRGGSYMRKMLIQISAVALDQIKRVETGGLDRFLREIRYCQRGKMLCSIIAPL